MADKSSLRADKKQLVLDIFSLMYNAVEVYFNGDNRDDCEYAAATINFGKNLLNDMNF